MRHVILTCRNHRELRWGCKEIAFSDEGGYNGLRNIHFKGVPTGKGMYQDGSGLDCTVVPDNPNGAHENNGRRFDLVEECSCPASGLIRAPEDALVKR